MKFYAIGGFKEVGKNMTAIEVNGEVVIFDMGVSMEHLIELSAKGLNYENVDDVSGVDLKEEVEYNIEVIGP